jgi:glycosyltransferase involved in cell wall biosynthesis
MNILMLYTNNPFQASGIVALNIFNELKGNGHNVRLLTNRYDPDYPDGIISMESAFYSKWKTSILKYKFDGLKRRLKILKEIDYDNKYHFSEFAEKKLFYKTKNILKSAGIKPDIIIVLFTKGFINAKNIFELGKLTNARSFWLMYDMSPLTGGCHYAWDCKGYQNSCGSCPGLASSYAHDISFENLKFKIDYLGKSDIELIAASEWQYRQAFASSIFKKRKIHKILLSADPEIFKPVHKETERSKIGIPAGKKVIFFGSIELTMLRKGMIYLLESLKLLKDKVKNTELESDILLLIAGRNIKPIVDELPFDYHFLGLLDNRYGIAAAYQMADVFLCPSIEDSGPTMINQSVMTGTPVVAFEMGVSPDLVISGKTGYMARLCDSADMAKGLFEILSLPQEDYSKLSDNCRQLALKVCSPEVQTQSFENLFHNAN